MRPAQSCHPPGRWLRFPPAPEAEGESHQPSFLPPVSSLHPVLLWAISPPGTEHRLSTAHYPMVCRGNTQAGATAAHCGSHPAAVSLSEVRAKHRPQHFSPRSPCSGFGSVRVSLPMSAGLKRLGRPPCCHRLSPDGSVSRPQGAWKPPGSLPRPGGR